MPRMRELHLIAPGLAAWREAPHGELLRMPGLEKLLACGHIRSSEVSLADILCQAFAVARQQDAPLAPITALYDGLDSRQGYWLRADPAHLQLGMRGVTLLDAGHVGLTAEESGALAAALQPLFAAAAWRLHAPYPGRWYASSAEPIELKTTPIDQVATRHVNSALPVGPSAAQVMRLINDAQIILHDHPVNQAREARGQAPINSLWLWGGGEMPNPMPKLMAKTDRNFRQVLAAQPEALALAAFTHIRSGPCPGRFDALPDADSTLLVLPDFPAYASSEDAARLDADWFTPLLRGLRRGRIRAATLTLTGPEGQSAGIGMLDAWKFWKRPAVAGPD